MSARKPPDAARELRKLARWARKQVKTCDTHWQEGAYIDVADQAERRAARLERQGKRGAR